MYKMLHGDTRWKKMDTMPRDKEVLVFSEYKCHVHSAVFKESDTVPDTLIAWCEMDYPTWFYEHISPPKEQSK